MKPPRIVRPTPVRPLGVGDRFPAPPAGRTPAAPPEDAYHGLKVLTHQDEHLQAGVGTFRRTGVPAVAGPQRSAALPNVGHVTKRTELGAAPPAQGFCPFCPFCPKGQHPGSEGLDSKEPRLPGVAGLRVKGAEKVVIG